MARYFTTETAPKGYTGPVRLTVEQTANRDAAEARWIARLVDMARDDQDPETRDNARAYLSNRGLTF